MLGADERGVRRTCGYAAATSEEGNDADGKNHKPAKLPFLLTPNSRYSEKLLFRKRCPTGRTVVVPPRPIPARPPRKPAPTDSDGKVKTVSMRFIDKCS